MTKPERSKPSALQVVASVLAAFFGVQSQKNRERDFSRGNPLVFIIVGLVLTGAFVALVWIVVQMVLPD